MIRSMTGYGKAEGTTALGWVTVELSSVNHRNLDIRLKLPELIRFLDIEFRGIMKSKLKRGHIDGSIKVTADPSSPLSMPRLNLTLARFFFEEIQRFYRVMEIPGSPDPSWILNKPEVWETVEPEAVEAARTDLLKLFTEAIHRLEHSRATEGNTLQAFLERKLHEMDPLIKRVEAMKHEVPHLARESIEKKLQDLKLDPTANPDRVAQEVVYLAQRADIAEETARLSAHVEAFSRKLAAPETSGRELDFIIQEMNREVNTMGSKSISYELSSLIIHLKKIINQMREQVQNVE